VSLPPSFIDLLTTPLAGYVAVFVLIFLDSLSFIGIFIPGVPILVFAGALTAEHFFSFWTLALVCFAASILGKTVSFESARRHLVNLQSNSPLWGEEVEEGRSLSHRGSLAAWLAHLAGVHRHAMPYAEGTENVDRATFQLRSIPTAIARILWPLFVGIIVGSLWHVATLWSTRARLLFLVIILAFAFIGWLWGWTVRRGRSIVRYFSYLGQSLVTATLSYPPVKAWRERSPKLSSVIGHRLTPQHFTGLPLTFLILLLSDTLLRLLLLTQSVLSDGLITAADVRTGNLFLLLREKGFTALFLAITHAASADVMITAGTLTVLLLFFQREKIYAWGMLAALVANQVTVTLLKNILHRARPDYALAEAMERSFSFPSGHAAASIVFYGFLAYIVLRTARLWKAKISALFLALSIIILVDLSRLYLGVHFLSDVLGGNLIGFSFLILAIIGTEWIRSQSQKETRLRPVITATIIIAVELSIILWSAYTRPTPPLPPEQQSHIDVAETAVLPLFHNGTLPLYTETLFATRQEPTHLIILAHSGCLVPAFARAQWSLADPLSTSSLKRAAVAVFLNTEYLNAPITPTFYDSRPIDFGFEKATDQRTIRSRHHLRVWQTPYSTPSGELYVGTASLDTGLKWGGAMHTIDPAIDTERSLILADLQNAGVLASKRILQLLPPSLGTNFTGDPYFTDGKVAFIQLQCE